MGGPMSVGSGDASAAGRDIAKVTQKAEPVTLEYLYQNYARWLYDYCEGLIRHPAAAADVEAEVRDRETRRVVTTALDRLSDGDREVRDRETRRVVTTALDRLSD